jgi:deoxyribodipyrimidine photo-lyase
MLSIDAKSPLPTRQFGLSKLASFLPRAAHHYGSLRNYDEGPGPRQHVSGLSPWISRRLITEREVIAQVLSGHTDADPACHPFLREVLWRGYWRSYLEHRPSLWTSYRQMLTEHPPANDPRYMQATQAQSGIDVFDHWVRELRSEGYLHNHARLWFASLWIHTLRLPWQWGAAWFLEQLLDGDAASNTLSWRWVAGLHTKGKAYLASADNIAKFTNQRLVPGLPASSLVPISDNADHPLVEPQLAPALAQHTAEEGEALLLLGDDLSVETLRHLSARALRAVAWMPTQKIASAFGWSDKVRSFHDQALQDARTRAEKIWPRAQCTILPAHDHEMGQVFGAWQALGIKHILVPAPHQGPYRDVWDKTGATLPGFEIVPFNRRYDIELAPLGKKGFFDFWQRRPDWQRLCQE